MATNISMSGALVENIFSSLLLKMYITFTKSIFVPNEYKHTLSSPESTFLLSKKATLHMFILVSTFHKPKERIRGFSINVLT